MVCTHRVVRADAPAELTKGHTHHPVRQTELLQVILESRDGSGELTDKVSMATVGDCIIFHLAGVRIKTIVLNDVDLCL